MTASSKKRSIESLATSRTLETPLLRFKPVLRTHVLALSALLLVLGCELGLGDDPGDVIFFPDDDDDSANDDDDDGDDDDFTNPDTTSRAGTVWILERRDLPSPDESEDRLFAAGSFTTAEPAAMSDLLGYGGLPSPASSSTRTSTQTSRTTKAASPSPRPIPGSHSPTATTSEARSS